LPLDFHIGDVVRLRRPHPCGGSDWTIVRLGADLGLRCTTCAHRVMLPRRDVERRMNSFFSRVELRDPFREQGALERSSDGGAGGA
jgi:hypothetical protein